MMYPGVDVVELQRIVTRKQGNARRLGLIGAVVAGASCLPLVLAGVGHLSTVIFLLLTSQSEVPTDTFGAGLLLGIVAAGGAAWLALRIGALGVSRGAQQISALITFVSTMRAFDDANEDRVPAGSGRDDSLVSSSTAPGDSEPGSGHDSAHSNLEEARQEGAPW